MDEKAALLKTLEAELDAMDLEGIEFMDDRLTDLMLRQWSLFVEKATPFAAIRVYKKTGSLNDWDVLMTKLKRVIEVVHATGMDELEKGLENLLKDDDREPKLLPPAA